MLRSLRAPRALAAPFAVVLAFSAGCAQLDVRAPEVDIAMPVPRAVAPVAPAPPASAGAIFQGQAYRPLFETVRARAPGDLVTVTIQENTTARQRSNASVNREGAINGSISALPALPASILGRARVGGSLSNSADAKGESASDNVFNGNITATVSEVLPNGNLVIVGEKQVGVNQTIDVLRFSGIVDPRFIRPGNTISSTQVADVRVQFRGRGDIDRAMTVGWLQRFFYSFAPL